MQESGAGRGTKIALLLIVGVSGLVFVGALIWALWPREIPAEPATPAPAPGDRSESFAYSEPCARIASGAADYGEIPAEGLPGDPQRVWLCGELGGAARLGPPEPLAGEAAAAVVEEMNALPMLEDEACTEAYSLNYVVGVEYEDEIVYLDADTVNCSNVGPTRTGAPELLERLLEQWEERRRDDPPQVADVDVCEVYEEGAWTGINTLLEVTPADAVEASACGQPEVSTGGPVRVELGEEALALFAEATWEEPGPEGLGSTEGMPLILLRSEHGDSLSILRDEEGRYVRTDSLTSGIWIPDEAQGAVLDEALAGLMRE